MTRALLALLLLAGQLPVAADHRVIVLLERPRAAPIEQRNAARIYAKWHVVPGFAATVDDAELQRLLNDPDVLSVEPDLGGSVTPLSNEEWIGLSGQIALNGELIGLPAVQALGYDGTGSTVAVLGTGVSPHPDLKDRIIEERCYCAYVNGKGCCPNGATAQFGSGSARDDLPHETGVAGVIAGSGGIAPRGIAPGANIVAIRLSDGTGNVAWTSQVISALDWIAGSPLHVDAVNMSFAIGFLSNGSCDGENPALTDALARVRARGTVLVAASGNDAATKGIRPPACIGGVLSVGAVYHMNLASAARMHRQARGSRSCHVLLELRRAARFPRARLRRPDGIQVVRNRERQRNVILSAACSRGRGPAAADRSTADARRHRRAARIDGTSDRRQPQRHHDAPPRPLRGSDEAAFEYDAGATAPCCPALTLDRPCRLVDVVLNSHPQPAGRTERLSE